MPRSVICVAACVFLLCSACKKDSSSDPAPTITIRTVPTGTPAFGATSGDFSATSWGTLSSGPDTVDVTESSTEMGDTSTITFVRQDTSSTATVAAVQAVTCVEHYISASVGFIPDDETSSYALATNGWIYSYEDGLGWQPIIPATVQAGDRWTISVATDSLQSTLTSTVTSLSATAPNGRTGCIRLQATGTYQAQVPYLGTTYTMTCDDLTRDQYLQPGVGTVYEVTSSTTTTTSPVTTAWTMAVTTTESMRAAVAMPAEPLPPEAVN